MQIFRIHFQVISCLNDVYPPNSFVNSKSSRFFFYFCAEIGQFVIYSKFIYLFICRATNRKHDGIFGEWTTFIRRRIHQYSVRQIYIIIYPVVLSRWPFVRNDFCSPERNPSPRMKSGQFRKIVNDFFLYRMRRRCLHRPYFPNFIFFPAFQVSRPFELCLFCSRWKTE